MATIPPAVSRTPWLVGGLIALAAAAVYHNSFDGPFVFDDAGSITDNPTIRHLWPVWRVLAPPFAEGLTVGGRPVLNLSLAFNYAISGTNVWSYHALNLAIHILAGLTLFGLTRRTLQNAACGRRSPPGEGAPNATGRTDVSPTLLAFIVALLWTVHPLQTEAVTYVVQRAESLMGLFYLQTLYCFIRGVEADGAGPAFALRASAGEKAARRRSLFWFGLSWLACLFGISTKEVMVSAPIIVFLYDRTFMSGSFREAWRRRREYYVALAATWILLALLVAGGGGDRGGSSGFDLGVSWGRYALTQFPAVARYLRLAVWPHPLVIDYGAEWVRSPEAILPAVALVILLLMGTGAALLRAGAGGRALGFAGAWFWLVLAPTSLVPGTRLTMAEHRMYLALAPLLAAGVGLAVTWLGRRSLFGILGAAVGLGGLTIRRNEDYRGDLDLWRQAVANRPDNPYAHFNLGVDLVRLGYLPEGQRQFGEALRLKPDMAEAQFNLGNVFLRERRVADAADRFAEAARLRPDYAPAQFNLANAWAEEGRFIEAAERYRTVLRLEPELADPHVNYGNVLEELGRRSEAVGEYRVALKLDPGSINAHINLGGLLAREGRWPEAEAEFREALRLDPNSWAARENLARVKTMERRVQVP